LPSGHGHGIHGLCCTLQGKTRIGDDAGFFMGVRLRE